MFFIKKTMAKLNIQNILVSLCLLAVCVATQQIQTVKWDTGIIEFSCDALGVLMAIILFTHYKWSDFTKHKIPYIIWSIVGILAGAIFTPMAIARRAGYLMADTIIIALGIFLMGYCIIHTAITFFIEKYRPKLYLPLFIIWVVLLLWMVFSKSEYLWPECYFVLFLCYYMTPQTSTQRTNVTKGVVNGIILGFIAIQAHALLCRPYDRVRYCGNFCNPNNNAIFLCICLAAIFAKILFITKENKKLLEKIFYFLLAGACYSMIFMTVSRSGYLVAVVMTIFFLISYCSIREKKVFFRMGVFLVLLFVAMLPLTYLAVRYIPTIRPHVLFYHQEGYSESRVHSWDERNSEKYVSFEELIKHSLGRFTNISGTSKNTTRAIPSPVAEEFKIVANSDYLPLALLTQAKTNATLETDPDKIPVLQDQSNALLVRYHIYKWFFTHITLRGMPYDEQGFQLTPGYWVQHPHNIYLYYGINFGYPAMILFAIFIWWGIGRLVKQGLRMRDVEKWSCLLIAIVPPVFGMFEFAWGPGMLSTVAFYLVFKEMVNN